MERKGIYIPMSSLLIREFSLLSAVLYFFALTIPNIATIISVIISLCVLEMIISILLDNKLQIGYKIFIISILVVSCIFVLYGLYFSDEYAQYNSFIIKIGSCLTCGGLLLYGLVGLFLKKRSNDKDNVNETKLHFVDFSCVLVLFLTVFANL